MTKEFVGGNRTFVLRGFLPAEECADFIGMSEGHGYEAATVTSVRGVAIRTDVRNNDRIIWDDPDLAKNWWERIAPHLPSPLGEWHAVGLNERFRFYRYDVGQSFKRHYDGSYRAPNGDESLLTLLVYLNDDFEGGTTDFYDRDDNPTASVAPRQGTALVFDHLKVHEGTPVTQGRKYVLRTDVMYRRKR